MNPKASYDFTKRVNKLINITNNTFKVGIFSVNVPPPPLGHIFMSEDKPFVDGHKFISEDGREFVRE